MPVFNSDISGFLYPPATSSQAGVVLASIAEASLPDSLAGNDLVKLNKLPAGHRPLDFQLEAESLDDGSGITISVGVLNADGDDLVASTNFITDDTVAQAGGVKRADVLAGLGLAESTEDRVIAAKITTAAGTAAAGALRGKLLYAENA
jgi:hypothetical protein